MSVFINTHIAGNIAGAGGVVAYSDYLRSASGSSCVRIKSTGNDQTAEIQQAIDDMFASKGGTTDNATTRYNTAFTVELVDGDEYYLYGLSLPPGCTITSTSRCHVPFSDMPSSTSGGLPVSAGPVIHHIFSNSRANQPLFANDRTKGIARTVGGQQFANINLLGLTMVADRFSSALSARGNSDFIRFQDVFSGNIFGCLGFTSAGFGIKLLNCNGMRIAHNTFINAPWMFCDLVDSTVIDNQVGGGNGLAGDSVWISGDAGVGAFISQYQSNIWFNSQSNGNYSSQYAPEMTITAIDTSTDIITLDTNVQQTANNGQNWGGEVPVVFSTVGTLPTLASGSVSVSGTYWVTVVGPSQIKLSRSWTDRINQVYLDFTAAGSGNKLRVGQGAVLHLNDGAHNNNFFPLRCDQGFGDLIYLNGATDNVFAGLNLQYAHMGLGTGSGGYVDPVAGAAVKIVNSSTGNSFLSGTVDGVQHGSGGAGPSNQKYGFDIDSSSMPGTIISQDLNVINHTAANSSSGAAAYAQADVNPRRIVLGPADFTGISGTVTVGVPLVRRQGLNLAASSSAASNQLRIPSSWRSVRARIRWANSSTTAGSIVWAAKLAPFDTGADGSLDEAAAPNGLNNAGTTTVIPVGGDQYIMKETVLSLGNLSSAHYGKFCAFRVYRNDATVLTLAVLEIVLEEDI